MASSAAKTESTDPVRAYLEAHGVDPRTLDREPPSVTALNQEQSDPMSYIGAGVDILRHAYRFSQVATDSEVEKLKGRGFEVLADWRGGPGTATQNCEIWVRGMGRKGVIMGRPKNSEAVYMADRARRDAARRHGKRTGRQEMGFGGGAYLDETHNHEQGTVEDR